MTINVRLLFSMKEHAPAGEPDFEYQASPGITVGSLLKSLGIAEESFKVILVNGRQARPEQTLAEQDILVVFPPVEGG